MSYDDKDNYQAGHEAGVLCERQRTKQLRRDMSYFLGVAIDYIKVVDSTGTMQSRMEKFMEELRRGA